LIDNWVPTRRAETTVQQKQFMILA
jgi:hypothetical protein